MLPLVALCRAGAGGVAEEQSRRDDDLAFSLFAVDFQKELVECVSYQLRIVVGECRKRRRLKRSDTGFFINDERDIPGNLPAAVPDRFHATRNPFDRNQDERGESLCQQGPQLFFQVFRSGYVDVADRIADAVLLRNPVEFIESAVAFPVGGDRPCSRAIFRCPSATRCSSACRLSPSASGKTELTWSSAQPKLLRTTSGILCCFPYSLEIRSPTATAPSISWLSRAGISLLGKMIRCSFRCPACTMISSTKASNEY